MSKFEIKGLFGEIWEKVETGQLDKRGEPSTPGAWLVLVDDSGTYASVVSSKLKRLGRTVLTLTLPSDPTEDRVAEKIEEVLSSASSTSQLEGIAYLWGLTDDLARDQKLISLPFLTLCQILSKRETFSKVVVITRGILPPPGHTYGNPSSSTLLGIAAAFNYNLESKPIRLIDLSCDEPLEPQLESVVPWFWNPIEEIVAFRRGSKLCPRLVPVDLPISSEFPSLLKPNLTYLVVGGVGGIGFEIAKWMLAKGAGHVVLASRSRPNAETSAVIKAWNEEGHHVEAISVDVGKFEAVESLFEQMSHRFPPLGGVQHIAGIIQPGIHNHNISWSSALKTYNAKVDGLWNLHEITKSMKLDHFVIHSGCSYIFGLPYPADLLATISFEDGFADYRRQVGLPAMSIQWGQWGEVGCATKTAFAGVPPILTAHGMLTMEGIMKSDRVHTAPINIQSFPLFAKISIKLKTPWGKYCLNNSKSANAEESNLPSESHISIL